ncbi:hypothetical protein [Nannocystis sp.]|uniref:hypothetical protein n=1 Tax=Nannocystis sp. TaxID=1962667 RepID=UPI0025E34D62|nr:hypothetical protein [Nannocystis sp.]MBK7826817.1 hypothetical protein [Nannocystis sp.]
MYHDQMHRMRGVGFDAMLISQQARISDKFSSGQLANNTSLQNRLETVAFGLRSRHEVADFRADPWYPRADALGALVSHARIEHNQDRFFPRGQEGQVGATLHVISLIEEPDNKRIIVADPF